MSLRAQRGVSATRRRSPSATPREEDGVAIDRPALILNAAIALSMTGDAPGLGLLARRHGSEMAGGPLAEPFAMLIDAEPEAARPIAERLADVDRMAAFMADYRKRRQTASVAQP